jgi:hypothetical protein
MTVCCMREVIFKNCVAHTHASAGIGMSQGYMSLR